MKYAQDSLKLVNEIKHALKVGDDKPTMPPPPKSMKVSDGKVLPN
jgi:hypothetical protein